MKDQRTLVQEKAVNKYNNNKFEVYVSIKQKSND